MTASVAGNMAVTKVRSLFQTDEDAEAARQESHRDAGNLIAQTLGELKGAVMKVGQMASIAHDVLPKELSEARGAADGVLGDRRTDRARARGATRALVRTLRA
jgi:aspartate aminotransferase-like enzyme